MHEIEFHLEQMEPRTVQLARELLGIAVTILAHQGEDSESTLAQGPVLEIVRNVVSSLEWLKAETKLGSSEKRRDD